MKKNNRGRPKKDGTFVNCYLRNDIVKALGNYCALTGDTKTQAIEKAIQALTFSYQTDGDAPVKAVFLHGASEYARAVARNEGHEPVITEEPCYVLGETTVGSMPYYRIVVNGKVMETPQSQVRFISAEK